MYSPRVIALLLGLLSGALSIAAQGDESVLAWKPVDSARLDELRGGFDTPTGLRISFAIERTAYVNGVLVSKLDVAIPDVSKMTSEQAAKLNEAANGVVLIRNGPNNNFDINSIAPGATVIQNTLNDQHIVTQTNVTADVNTLSMYQGLNVQETLQRSLSAVTNPR